MNSRTAASDLFAAGWLSPRAAADALGISLRQLENRARNGDIKRRSLVPHGTIYVYEVPRRG